MFITIFIHIPERTHTRFSSIKNNYPRKDSLNLNDKEVTHKFVIKNFQTMSMAWGVSGNIWALAEASATKPTTGFVDATKSNPTADPKSNKKNSGQSQTFSITDTASQSIWGNYQPTQYVFFTGNFNLFSFIFSSPKLTNFVDFSMN